MAKGKAAKRSVKNLEGIIDESCDARVTHLLKNNEFHCLSAYMLTRLYALTFKRHNTNTSYLGSPCGSRSTNFALGQASLKESSGKERESGLHNSDIQRSGSDTEKLIAGMRRRRQAGALLRTCSCARSKTPGVSRGRGIPLMVVKETDQDSRLRTQCAGGSQEESSSWHLFVDRSWAVGLSVGSAGVRLGFGV